MAPRGRIRKRGNLRIDAALDAMIPFGFPSKLVRDTVKELLTVCGDEDGLFFHATVQESKRINLPFFLHRARDFVVIAVYGGDDGWVFIEEGSYTLLIDTILEKQKDGAIEQVHEDNGRDEVHEEITSIAGCSSSCISRTSSSNPGAALTVKQSDNVLISPFEDNEAFRITTPLTTNDSEERYRKDDEASVGDGHFRSPVNQSSPVAKIRRKKPYHGWISCDEKKEDLVRLPPYPLVEEFVKLPTSPQAQRKRKTRWDVKPAES